MKNLFMKLYLLNYYESHNALPVIDKVFINSCMKIMCNEKPQGRPPKKEIKELKDKLTAFYNTDFQPLIQHNRTKKLCVCRTIKKKMY